MYLKEIGRINLLTSDEEFEYANNYLKILKHELAEAKKQLYYLKNKSNNDIFNLTEKQYFN